MRYLYCCLFFVFFGFTVIAQQVFSVLPVTTVQNMPIKVPYSFKGITINNGNIYTLQLSDEKGSFAKPTNIDSLKSNVDSGVFTSLIPSNQNPGANYRVRVLSSNPAKVSIANNSNIVIVSKNQAFRNDSLRVQWDARFGGTTFQYTRTGFQTLDKGYLIGGACASGKTGDKTQTSQGGYDYWIVKTDSLGKKQWDYRYGGTKDDYPSVMIQTHDGGYMLGGSSDSDTSGDKSQKCQGVLDYWVIKIDSAGKKQWDARFGGNDYDYLSDLILTPDGGYLLGGHSCSGISGDKSQASNGGCDYWIIKIDNVGNKVWDKTYGGSDLDVLRKLKLTHDNNYILAGYSYSPISGDKSQKSQGADDYWIIKIDSIGNKIWDKTYGGNKDEYLTSMNQTNDHGFILVGSSLSGKTGDKTQASQGDEDYWVVKIDSSGSKQWDKRYGGKGTDGAGSIIQTPDNGYIIAGSSLSDSSGDKSQYSIGGSDYWLVKIDSQGSKIWDRRFGGSGNESIQSVQGTVSTQSIQMTLDGGISLFGYTSSPVSGDKSQPKQGSDDYWILKLGYPNIASFVVDSDTQCLVNNLFDFKYKGQIGAKFYWNFGEGANDTSTVMNPTKIYKNLGNYTVKLIVTDSFNYTDSTSIQVAVIKNVQASFTVNDSMQNINGNSFVFTNNSSNAQQYFWNFGFNSMDTSSAASPAAKVYSLKGEYLVNLIAANPGCKDTSNLYVYVLDQQVYTVFPNPVLQNEIVRVPFSFDNKMNSANIYILQMSNAKGDFANAVFLDTIKSTQQAGMFKTTIPKNQLPGAGYRFRVTSSNPALISKISNENIIICNSSNLRGDSIYKQWDKRFGGSIYERLSAFQQTRDNGFILSGYSTSGNSGDKSQTTQGDYDYWVVKIDSNGSKQWDKRFGGKNDDRASCIKQTRDGGYIIGGYSQSDSSGDRTQKNWYLNSTDYWTVKIDSVGNKQWDKRYGTVDEDYMTDVNETSDGGYIIGGYSEVGISGDSYVKSKGGTDYWIIKIDSKGNKQWDKGFGGTGDDYLKTVQQTKDGGYILGGYSPSGNNGDKSEKSQGGNDYWTIKTDMNGEKLWDKSYGGNNDDYFQLLEETADDGYILGGVSNSGNTGDKSDISYGLADYWIVKVDSFGKIIWDKSYGGNNSDVLTCIKQTIDKGYIIGGYSSSDTSAVKKLSNKGQIDYWIIKTDDSGKYINEWDLGGSNDDYMTALQQTSDGGFAFAGYTYSNNGSDITQSSRGYNDYWIYKLALTNSASFDVDIDSQCLVGNKYTFLIKSKKTNCTYKWNFGETANDTSTLKKPIKTYSNTGNYIVTLEATDSLGSAEIYKKTVFVRSGNTPAISFDIKDSSQCLKSNSFVPANNTIGASSYQWNFGEGIYDTSTAKSPVKVYKTSGTYTVLLIAASGNCKSILKRIVNVKPSPTAVFTRTQIGLKNYIFTNNSIGYSQYIWNFGTNSTDTSTQMNPTKTYTSNGLYTVSLIVTNDSNCFDTTSKIINISPQIYNVLPCPVVAGNNISIPYDFKGTNIQSGNSFIVQLSDRNGSFKNATVIDSINTVVDSGVIVTKIPLAQNSGAAYRVRILSTNTHDSTPANNENIVIVSKYNATRRDSLSKQWDQNFSATYHNWVSSIQQVHDKEYLYAKFENGIWGFNIEKTDSNGQYKWYKKIDGSYYGLTINKLKQTVDGGYILGGFGFDYYGFPDYYVVKTDSVGNKEWGKYYGGNASDKLDDIQPTSDGGYIYGGTSYSSKSRDKSENSQGGYDCWVVKVDQQGDIEWEKAYGGNQYDLLTSIQQTNDGGYILGGYSKSDNSGDKSENSQGDYDYWVVKIDKYGSKQWDKTYGGDKEDALYSLVQTNDLGYILGGYSKSGISGNKTQASQGSYDYWVVKINKDGAIEWDEALGGSGDDFLYSIKQTADLGYVLGGTSNSNKGGDKSENSKNSSDYWVVKLDSSGVKEWDKVYGGTKDDRLISLQQTSDGGYVLGGGSFSDKNGDKSSVSQYGKEQSWIVKLGFNDTTSFNINNITQCIKGNSFQFTVNGTYDNVSWSFGENGTDTSSLKTPNKTYHKPGKYLVSLFVYNKSGFSATSSQSVYVSDNLYKTINATICNGEKYVFNGKQLTQTGVYYDTILNVQSCDSIIELTLNINPLPVAQITSWDGVMFTSSIAQLYQWYLNGSVIPGANLQTYKPISNGSYTVQVTDTSHCENISTSYILSNLYIQTIMEEKISISPNPTKGIINIYIPIGKKVSNIYITDLNGKMIKKIAYTSSSIDISEFAQSLYLLHIDGQVIKIVKD